MTVTQWNKNGISAASAPIAPTAGQALVGDGTNFVMTPVGGGGSTDGFVYAGGGIVPANSINIPYFNNSPLKKAAAPNAFDDYFETAVAGWTLVNTPTVVWNAGTMSITGTGTGGSNIRGAYKAVPAGSWTITTLVFHSALQEIDFFQTGAFVSDGIKFITLGLQDTGHAAYLKRYPSFNSNEDNLVGISTSRYQKYAYYRFKYVAGASLQSSISWDGVNWFVIATEAWNSYLTPTQFGIFMNTVSAQAAGVLFAICPYVKLTSP